MQIFDRKHWIEGQLRQQIDSYGQTLASNLIAEGGRPPPWLWAAGSDADPKGLSREELISRILFLPPLATTSLANQSTLFMLPTLISDDVSQSNRYYNETCAPDKYFIMEDRDRTVLDEGKAVKACAELRPLAVMQSYRSGQMDPEIRPVKRARTAEHACKDSSFDEFTGRVARSMAASLKSDCVKESLEGNKNLSVSHNKDGGKCTRLRSAARKLHCGDELSKPGKPLNRVEDVAQEEAETRMDTEPVLSTSVGNNTLDNSDNIVVPQPFNAENVAKDVSGAACAVRNGPKMSSVVASRVPKITSLVEPKHLLFDGIDDCCLNNNSIAAFEKENQSNSSYIALTKSEAVQTEKEESSCRDSKNAHDPSANRLLQEEDVLHTVEIMHKIGDAGAASNEGPEEGRVELVEVEDLECDSRPGSCNSKPSKIPGLSSWKTWLSEEESTHSSPMRSSFVRDCMLCSDVNASGNTSDLHEGSSSLGSVVQYKSEELCSKKHGMSRSIEASKQAEASSLVEPKNPLFHEIEDYGLHENSYLENALSKLEAVQSVEEESVVRDFKRASNCSVNGHLQMEDVLHTAEVTSSIDKVNRFFDHSQPERPDLLETKDLESDSDPTLCNVKPSSVPATASLNESALSYSSPVTDYMLNSVMDLSGQINVFQDGSKTSSLESLVRYPKGENCSGKLIKETTGSPLQLINTAHNDDSVLCYSKANEVFMENEEAETALTGLVNTSVALPTITPDPVIAQNTMLEVGHILWSSDANVTNSTSHSSIKAGAVLEPQETVVHANSMQKHVVRQMPNTTDIHKALPETRYFLRSSASFEKKLGSRKRSNSVLHSSEENCILPEAHTNEIHADEEDAAEKNVTRDTVTPNSREIHYAQPKARYLLRSLTSHGKDPASTKSSGTNDAPVLGQQVEILDHACGITWPKRRKMEGRSNNILATSPRLRLKPLVHIQKGNEPICTASSENSSGAIIECQPFLSSSEMETKILDASLDNHLEELHKRKKHSMAEGNSYLKGKDHAVMTPLLINSTHEALLLDLADGDSKISLKDKAGIAESMALNLKQHQASVHGQHFLCAGNTLEHEGGKERGYCEECTEGRVKHDSDCSLCTHDSARLSQYDDNLDSYDETIPEFEGFSIDVPSIMEDGIIFNDSDLSNLTKERVSLLEKLCGSRCMLNPVSCPSSSCKIHEVPDVYQPLPAGLLEQMITNNSLQPNDVNVKQFRASEDGKVADLYCSLGQESDVSFLGRSHSYSMPSTIKYGYEARKPHLTPTPVEKLRQRVISRRSGASSEEVGSNPELICFRIDESSCSTEENMHVDELDATSEEGVDSRGIKKSTNRKALVDVTSVYQNAPTLVSVSEKYLERGSLDSVNTESYSGIQMDVNSNSGNECTGSGKSGIDDKENCAPSVSESTVRKSAEPFRNMSTKPELSGKANERNRSQSISWRGCKRNNIVSNIPSFIPLVRQRHQAAAPVTGKRDVKVKALEAAEAAKRLEEKKKNEREMRKAAAKLERVRLDQENVRQLELKQKKNVEARKKKEADFAARKRQREEERRGKERKRRCIDEVRKQQREKLHVGKELRHNAADEKEQRRKEGTKETKRQLKSEKLSEVSGYSKLTEPKPATMIVADDARHGSNTMEAHGAFKELNDTKTVVNNSCGPRKAIQDRMSVTKESQSLLSYAITPYRDSDDEDGEEDIRRKRKYIPLWARRECLDQILLSKQHIDPTKIFSRKSSFSLSEVLSPQIHRGPLSLLR